MKRISRQGVLLFAITMGLLAGVVPTSRLLGQNQTEAKIRLMADGLRARDVGDYVTARARFEELLAMAPDDPAIQRLLAAVNAAAAGGSSASNRAVASAAPSAVTPSVIDFRALQASAESRGVSPPETEADRIARAEEARLASAIDVAQKQRKEAKALLANERFEEAIARLESAAASLPLNALTQKTLSDIEADRQACWLAQSQVALKTGDIAAARAALERYAENGGTAKAEALNQKIERAELDPELPSIEKANPAFIVERKQLAQLAVKGRSQYLAGDLDGAQDTYRQVEAIDPDHAEAKSFLGRIAHDQARIGELNREKTRMQMVEEVTKGWQRPGIYEDRSVIAQAGEAGATPLAQKLATIQIPAINFANVELGRVVTSLSAISEEFDPSTGPTRGVNIVLIDPSKKNPGVSITLRNMTLKRILDFITDSVGYQYEVQADAIVVRPGGETSSLDTAFFPITRSTVIRMTGAAASPAAAAPVVPEDIFSPLPTTAVAAGLGGAGEAPALRGFLQQAGVNFDNVPGSTLAYDGSAMIVTNTTRNLERIRNILNRYNDVRQVEIEAKFMEVQEGALEELGVQWNVNRRATGAVDSNGKPIYKESYRTGGRSLGQAFTNTITGSNGSIVNPGREGQSIDTDGDGVFDSYIPGIAPVDETIVNNAPTVPGGADLARDAIDPLALISGVIGEFDVNAVIRALSRQTGSDLLSAPKVTVLSGNPAKITVAQELRYPQSYGEIQSEVGNGSSSSLTGGSAGVTITAATPQDFTTRNVGVELAVTPTVEEDDYSISLDLNPRVTEFEGFVEYGGQSVAIAGGTTVNIPSGFFQPIFSTREISTKVTIWDGATLVMGGLTREEVKKVNDKVPVLGDIPLIGRAFRSQGETSQKRNLLVFVTANLVSPGGSPKKQAVKGVPPSSLFQNPTLVTPGGSEARVRAGK